MFEALEIAKLTGKRHNDVMRDCRVMFEALEMDEEVQRRFARYYKATNGKKNPMIELPEDLVNTLITGY
tara:strand:- start:514 stop:720 length:207 start_codon:yes stop_codon:yes gene_type:complete